MPQFDREGNLMRLPDRPLVTQSTVTPTVDPYEAFLQEIAAGKYSSGGANASAYMGQAQGMLGGLDTSGFDQLRQSLTQSNQLGMQSLEQSYQTLLESLAGQQKENRQDFGAARGTIMENAFGRNRDAYRNLASRGLGASGLQQLGEVQNRMETGRQVSGVAGQFYDASEKIADAKEQGTESYQNQQGQLANQLQQNLASLQQQELSYKNSYQQQLASLASQLAAQAASSSSSNLQMMMSAKGELAKLQSEKTDYSAQLAVATSDLDITAKVAEWKTRFGGTDAQAMQAITALRNQSTAGKKAEFFTTLDTAFDRVATSEDVTSIMNLLKTKYTSGELEIDDISSYVSKNMDKIIETAPLLTKMNLMRAKMLYSPQSVVDEYLRGLGIISDADQAKRFKMNF